MYKTLLVLLSVVALTLAPAAAAQEAGQANEDKPSLRQQIEDLRRQLDEERKLSETRRKEMLRQIEDLNERTKAEALRPQGAQEATAQPESGTSEQIAELKEKVERLSEAQKKTLLSEFNPSIGFVGETIFGYRSRNRMETGSERPGGFDVFQRSVEINAAGSVDPFVKAYVVANATADPVTGESSLGIEEAALQTTSLPWNLELKAGRFFGEFGRLSYIHDHELPFVNRPLVLDQYVGGESRTGGFQVNWLAPVKHYISLTAGMGTQFGGDSPNPNNPGSSRNFGELNFFGRLSTYFDLAPDWQLETGVSGLYNPSTEDRGGALLQPDGVATFTEKERRLAGLDFKVSWVPLRNNQFQSVTWGTEVLYSDNRYQFDPDGTPDSGDETTRTVPSTGLYSYVTYKFHRQWSAGFLFDYVQAAENRSNHTYAYSPYVTWAISHWNQLRLQYTHTDHTAQSGLHDDDALMLQWAWIIGSHSHGWQQR